MFPLNAQEYKGLTPLRDKSGFSMILNSWIDANLDGRLSHTTITMVLAAARKGERFHLTRGNLVKLTGMSHTTVSKAFGELIELGVASHGYRSGQLFGYNLRMDVDIITPNPENGREPHPENGPHIKTPDSRTSSLRSEGRLASSLRSETSRTPGRVTISTAVGGQVGIDFHSTGPSITDRSIDRIVEELRRSDLRGDPEDDELRRFIAKRIEFIESRNWKGKPFETTGKDAERNNRLMIVQLCMGIVRKGPDWKTKRRDPNERRAAEAAQRTIDTLWKDYDTRLMRDGSLIPVDEYDRITERLRREQARLIAKDRQETRRPSWEIEDDYPLDRVARLIYAGEADHYLLSETDRDRRLELRNRVRDLEAGRGMQ